IGNGTETEDGAVEVSESWRQQRVRDSRMSVYQIEICLVGDFDQSQPTERQMQSLSELLAYLQWTFDLDDKRILGHRDTKPTDCPGKNLNLAEVRRRSAELRTARILRDGNNARAAVGE